MQPLAGILSGLALAAALGPAAAADWPARDDHDHTVPGSPEERASQAYEKYLQTKPLNKQMGKSRPGAHARRGHKASVATRPTPTTRPGRP